MPSINMIAARRADKRRLEQNRRKLFYVILGELGLMLIILSGMTVKLVATGLQSTELSAELDNLKGRVDQIQKLQDATATLQPKLTALDQATSNTLYWYTALQNVSQSLPQSAWLTQMATAGDAAVHQSAAAGQPAPGQLARVTFTGEAANQFDVGTAMLRLNLYPDIDNVKLHQITQDSTVKNEVNFQLEVQLKPQAPLTGALGGQNVQKS